MVICHRPKIAATPADARKARPTNIRIIRISVYRNIGVQYTYKSKMSSGGVVYGEEIKKNKEMEAQ